MTRLALAAALMLAACGDAPAPVASGPKLRATPAANFSDSAAPARQAEFSPDGKWLATTSAEGIVALRHMPDLKLGRRFRHEGGATAIAFAPDGRWLATAGYDGSVRVWDFAGGRLLRTLAGAQGTIWSIDVSPDGRQLAAAGEDRTIRLWDVATGRLLSRLAGHELNIWEVRFSPDGRRLASASFDTTWRLWDAATGAALKTIRGHEQAVVGLDWSPDGRWIATGGDDSTVRLWRALDGAPVRVMANGNHAYKVVFSADSRWLATSGRARGGLGTFWHEVTGAGGPGDAIRLWRVPDGTLVDIMKQPEDVMQLALSPDRAWLAAAREDGRISLWRLREPGGKP